MVQMGVNTSPVIDVIVPVYRGMAETRNCIESILSANVHTTFELIVINDASPDKDLVAWLEGQSRTERLTLVSNGENLGFVATANRGMALHQSRDVLLLNSDTIVANDWLDRIVAAAGSDPMIATVTPFSNNATICSYPNFACDNSLPTEFDVPRLDHLFATYNSNVIVDVPTGVGFCLYIRRKCLQAIGSFDADKFGKGYGEENDFCERAAQAGWRNVMAGDVFVEHLGNVSFGIEHDHRKRAAIDILRELHPRYEQKIARYIAEDPAREYRLRIDIARIRHTRLRRVLLVTHAQGGGTEQHCRELAERFKGEAVFLALKPYSQEVVCLELYYPGPSLKAYFRLPVHAQRLLDVLRFCNLSFIHFHHLLGHQDSIWHIADDLGVPYYFSAHDYFLYCPRIRLTGLDDRYCGEDKDGCEKCCNSETTNNSIELTIWRQRSREFLNSAKLVIAPSRDTTKRFRGYFPRARVEFSPHFDIDENDIPPPRMPVRTIPGEFRIAIIGALSKSKGADVLEQAVIEAHSRRLSIHFKLFGFPYRRLAARPNLTIHGEYQAPELDTLLATWNPHVVWFPAQWPETYSYTLSTCLRLGLPTVVPDIGAFPERVAGRHLSWIVPWQTTAYDMVDFFDKLHRGNMALPTISVMANAERRDFDYASSYIGPPPTEYNATEIPALWTAACSPPPDAKWSLGSLKSALLTAVHRIRYNAVGAKLVGLFPEGWRQRVILWLVGHR